MQMSVLGDPDAAWESFEADGDDDALLEKPDEPAPVKANVATSAPPCGDIYISTTTKIA